MATGCFSVEVGPNLFVCELVTFVCSHTEDEREQSLPWRVHAISTDEFQFGLKQKKMGLFFFLFFVVRSQSVVGVRIKSVCLVNLSILRLKKPVCLLVLYQFYVLQSLLGWLLKYGHAKIWACQPFSYQNLDNLRITLNYVGYFLEFNQMSAKIYRFAHVLACPHFGSQPNMPLATKNRPCAFCTVLCIDVVFLHY